MENIIKLTGKIVFDVEDKTNKHKLQSSWKKTAFVFIDGDACEYYSWFLNRRYNIVLNKPLRGCHVSFINDSIRDLSDNGQKNIEEIDKLWNEVKNRWDGKDIDKLQLLCMPLDKNLRCIRSLDASHIYLLEHMKQVTLQVIREKYGLEEEYIKMYFHYEPSTYHLHIHFVNTVSNQLHSSVEYSHELNSVIFNLKMKTDYYKIIKLNIRI